MIDRTFEKEYLTVNAITNESGKAEGFVKTLLGILNSMWSIVFSSYVCNFKLSNFSLTDGIVSSVIRDMTFRNRLH